jgi:hypothetical protein
MNKIPTTLRPLVALSTRAIAGVETLGVIIEIKANDLPTLAAAHFDLVGRPADPTAIPPVTAILGKHPAYTEAKAVHALARGGLRMANKDGYDFTAKAVNTLKGVLGRQWNSQWAAVGFTDGSLELPRNPLPVLSWIEAHLRIHSGHQVASMNITAPGAETLKQAIIAAQKAVDEAHAAEKTAKAMRDASLQRLRRRMGLLREELDTLLDPDDARWYQFGFRRPIDGETPDLIEELRLLPAGTGQVLVQWTRARLADNYRVSWKLSTAGPDAEPTQVGLFSDLQAVITGLTAGMTITVILTARNASGESAPVDGTIVVP